MNHKSERLGLTIVEVLVVIAITALIAGFVVNMISNARHTAGIARARGEAKSMAERVLRQLERDISASRADLRTSTSGGQTITPTFRRTGPGSCEMMVPDDRDTNASKRVSYSLNGSQLIRDEQGGVSRAICSNIKEFDVAMLSDELVSINLKTGVIADGQLTPQIHHQTMIVTIREAIKARLDDRWRGGDDILTNY